jgi:hypothetical protein
VRPGRYDGRFGTDEVRRDRRAAARHDDVYGQVVAVDPPAPRLVAVRAAEHPQPVAVAVGRHAGRQFPPDPLDLDGADREIAAFGGVGRAEQLDREGVLGAGEVLHRQARALAGQIGPLPEPGVGQVTADQAALLLVQAR